MQVSTGSVVQVTRADHQYNGALFVVGGVDEECRRVSVYQMANGSVSFLATVKLDDVKLVGTATIVAGNPILVGL